MYIYKKNDTGILYTSKKPISQEILYKTGSIMVGEAYSREEAWKLLHPLTNINSSGGYDYKYVKNFLDENFHWLQ